MVFAILSVRPNTVVIPFTNSLPLVRALLFCSMFIAGGFVVLSLSQGLAAQRNANPGILAGIWVAVWSIAVAIAMPVIGGMFDHRHYAHASGLLQSCLTLGGLAA